MLLVGIARVSAQSSPAPKPSAALPPVESVTVIGTSSEAVNQFVRAAAAPTYITGKVARWDVPICPFALGMPLDVTGLVVQRVKDVALKVGARVSSDPTCKPNIVVAFSTVPQELIESIRKDHRQWLGYHVGPKDLDRLARVTRPIQAWYSTATVDLRGRRQIDGSLIVGPSASPFAIETRVNGSRIADGLQSAFDHVVIIANPRMLRSTVSTVADYIAVLALAQINSLDTCQALPSVTSLLAQGCGRAATEITGNDLGYLKAVYAANPDKLPDLQKHEIAYRMEQEAAGR